MAAVLAVSVGAAACGGGDTPPSGETAAHPPPGTGYTSDQLQQALLTELPGYQRAGEPDSGEYGALDAIQNFNRLQGQVRLDKPQCANTTQNFDTTQQATPAAITTFAKNNGQNVTETLIRVSAETADRQVRIRVPPSCRNFRAHVGDQWSTHRVVEARGRLGEGSRTVGVATTSGTSHVKTWYVVLKARGYLATITLYGPNVTRAEAEQIARQAHLQAERILP
ncbi:hypothetical protein [Actinomadura alba]|uniref:PknH-like extracellular domain-containing protein n=1 Tax=Actinomadura alba TaxID=406431 RepID=A0ABR7LPQ9_9ACTN|nr:hypothetical protein [Actinomadura alba]MBC6466834.1 hypothetical protein [Actinomadura alba]